MNLVQMSRSLSDFLSNPGMYENTSQLKALGEQNTPFPSIKHPQLERRNECIFTHVPMIRACQYAGEPGQTIVGLSCMAQRMLGLSSSGGNPV